MEGIKGVTIDREKSYDLSKTKWHTTSAKVKIPTTVMWLFLCGSALVSAREGWGKSVIFLEKEREI